MRTIARIGKLAGVLVVVLLCSWLLEAKNKRNKSQEPQPTALVAGTVYRPPGFAMSGVEVVVEQEPSPSEVKFWPVKVATDNRGEFAVRLPIVPASYRVSVQVSGYLPQTKSVSVQGEQRFDLSFMLDQKPQGESK